jgi:hypothetical protein
VRQKMLNFLKIFFKNKLGGRNRAWEIGRISAFLGRALYLGKKIYPNNGFQGKRHFFDKMDLWACL